MDTSNECYRFVLDVAVKNDHLAILRSIVESGRLGTMQDINKNKKVFGYTPFLAAAMAGSRNVVRVLASHGFEDSDEKGHGGLSLAVLNGHLSTSKQLIVDDTFNINECNAENQTPLWLAAWKGHHTLIEELLRHKDIDVNAADATGCSPSLIATKQEHIQVVDQIIGRGIPEMDINQQDSSGCSPLHAGVMNGDYTIMFRLLAHPDINPLLSDKDGNIPFMLLEHNKSPARDVIYKVLEPYSRDLNPNEPEDAIW